MEDHTKIIEQLNIVLSYKLARISHSVIELETFENWGYEKLRDEMQKKTLNEMEQADMLIERILFLGGTTNVIKISTKNLCGRIEEQLENDINESKEIIKIYYESIQMAEDANDIGTAKLFYYILFKEENQLDWLVPFHIRHH